MTHFDLDAFLTEISPDAPCGEDISYDIEFLELDRLAQGTEETQVGDHIHKSEEPDWEKVKSQSLKLLEIENMGPSALSCKGILPRFAITLRAL